MVETIDSEQHDHDVLGGDSGTKSSSLVSSRRLWFWRLSLGAGGVAVYAILPDPFDTWLLITTLLLVGVWAYNRVCKRLKLPRVSARFERIETITLTHVLLALLLLALLANRSELVNLKKATTDVESSVTDLQNSASDNTDEIKSSLDDVTTAVQASQ